MKFNQTNPSVIYVSFIHYTLYAINEISLISTDYLFLSPTVCMELLNQILLTRSVA